MKKRLFIVLVCGIFLILSCSQKQPMRKYFIFEFTSQDFPAIQRTDTTFNYIVDVRDFRVARAFDQTRMVVRTQSNELKYYYYHHWAVRPSYAVADLVYDYFDYQRLFNELYRGISYNPDFIISGQVRSIERLQTKVGDIAHINIVLKLQSAEDETTVMSHEATLTEKLDDQSMNGFVHTLNKNLLFTLEQFKRKIIDYLGKNADNNQTK